MKHLDIRKAFPPGVMHHLEPKKAKKMYQFFYDDITSNGCAIQLEDRVALGELATTYLEVITLRNMILENGETIQVQGDRNIITKRNPDRDSLEKVTSRLLKYLKEFKMTPASKNVSSQENFFLDDRAIEFDNFKPD